VASCGGAAERKYVTRSPFWWGSSIRPAQAKYDGSANPDQGGGSAVIGNETSRFDPSDFTTRTHNSKLLSVNLPLVAEDSGTEPLRPLKIVQEPKRGLSVTVVDACGVRGGRGMNTVYLRIWLFLVVHAAVLLSLLLLI
jgi:hypothetical protein